MLKIATSAGLQVIPRGGATQTGWGNPPRGGDLILSTRRLNRVVEHAWGDMTATVDAGCRFQQLQQTLAEHGQRLALDPLWPDQSTIGGILATNDSGPLRIRFGSLRDLVIGITLALPDGTLAKSGGKVVKNVAGYDLPKLATGSLGTLGIITQAIFRLHPIPRESRTLSFSNTDSGTMNALILAIQDCNMVPTGVQVRAGSSSTPEVDLRFEGTAAGCEAQIEQTLRIASGARRIESPADVLECALNIVERGRTFRRLQVQHVARRTRNLPNPDKEIIGAAAVALAARRSGGRSRVPSAGGERYRRPSQCTSGFAEEFGNSRRLARHPALPSRNQIENGRLGEARAMRWH